MTHRRGLPELLFVAGLIFLTNGFANSAEKENTLHEPTTADLKFFENDVRPLLAAHCFKCHGEEKQQGELRLDSLAAMTHGGESGPAIVPGKPDESLLLEAVRHESYEMPPTGKLSDEKIATLARWVEMGAPWSGAHGDFNAAERHKEKITDVDRAYWAFQPPQKHPVPAVEKDDWSTTNIDRFVLRRMQEAGLTPAKPAERRTLIRRVYFDVLGVPPTPAEVAAFVQDNSADAWPKLVDRLLERPEYGEHWAKLWLDLVRYAESDGFRQDAYRPTAWRYRDYVIRSLNEDKPYNQFIAEQLAGDEIAPHNPDALAATGYFTHGVYEHNQRDVRTQWQDILNDMTDVTAEVFLATGMGCARCHDHKFDPILQKDYFRLQAFFQPIQLRQDVPLATPAELAEHNVALAAWEAKTADIRDEIAELEAQSHKNAANSAIRKFPRDIKEIIAKPAAERTPYEQQLALLSLRQVVPADVKKKLPAEKRARWEELQNELAKFAAEKPKPLPTGQTVTDVRGQSPPTRIVGKRKSEIIAPGFLSVLDPTPAELLPPPNSQTTGRRSTLASWIASENNPLTSRVIVNRVWQQHFGRGIVSTPSDFGRLGESPTHPELLDYLALTFIEDGWSLKKLHRRILQSQVYQQSSANSSPNSYSQDSDNRWLSRMPVRRLKAEQIRDAALVVSGELNLNDARAKRSGPPESSAGRCRTIFTKVLRNRRDPLLDAFDAPDYFTSSATRNVTTTAPQSLLLINGDWTLQRAKAFANRLSSEKSTEAKIHRAFELAWGRGPSQAEVNSALEFVNRTAIPLVAKPKQDRWADNPAGGILVSPESPDLVLSGAKLPAEQLLLDFTFRVDGLYPDASVRTLLARWDGSKTSAGWSVGVTSAKSAYKPRNLIVQLVGEAASKQLQYEVVASNLRPELGKRYRAQIAIEIEDGENLVHFLLQDLSDPDAPLQTAVVPTKITSLETSAPLTLGHRTRNKSHRFAGVIRQLQISNTVPTSTEKRSKWLAAKPAEVIGRWQFFGEDPLQDISANDNHFAIGDRVAPNVWVDFCHVLLNASESLYLH